MSPKNSVPPPSKKEKSTGRVLFAATEAEILAGLTTDVYLARALKVLKAEQLADTEVVMEVFSRGEGVFCGVVEAINLLRKLKVEAWALNESQLFHPKECVLRIRGPYSVFGLFETAILGLLASSSAWATAAAECRQAAGELSVLSFGARHIHPAVAPVMDRAAFLGGVNGVSTVLGASYLDIEPSGTMPHALILIMNDTVKAAEAFERHLEPKIKRTVLVDTFKDEVEESLRVAQALGKNLYGLRFDTPAERGGVTPDLIKEARLRLDLAGYKQVKLFVSGGLSPQKIRNFIEQQAPVDGFGVGSYIAGARPIDFTADIKEVAKRPVAKRGRIPGLTANWRLNKVL